ncbi:MULTISPECIES: DUF2187 family protein [Metabacillus]|uniref:DUF2187 family protein n=1 Tax=Metabacillus TaxID=2675233 RepID=UPI000C80B2CC|nr:MULTISPECIES: DUF2187 family protein [Metabacillus]MCM3443288.1 YkvS family protein [Metabacillus halosaccharovorans]PMC34204.1 hypothetical protein CJ195_24080 [Bacillus sp. UMB0899]
MKQQKNYSKKNALIGDTVQFERKTMTFSCKVIALRENSVIVELSELDAKRLEVESTRTVVNHKNYKIKKRNSIPAAPTFSYVDSYWSVSK